MPFAAANVAWTFQKWFGMRDCIWKAKNRNRQVDLCQGPNILREEHGTVCTVLFDQSKLMDA